MLRSQIDFEQHAPGQRAPFWVPDRLWRGRLPECFATVQLADLSRFHAPYEFDLRRTDRATWLYEI